MKIAIFGPEGTFTEQAALIYAKEKRASITPVFFTNIHDIFDAVKKGLVNEGIVPLENMIDGSVGETLDALYHSELKIIEEIVVPISQCIAILPSADIKDVNTVVSHYKALGQCSNFLRKKKFILKEALSTADAMKQIKERKLKDCAAIGPELAAKKYGLKIVARSIEDRKDNVTRFVVISKIMNGKSKGKYKTSIAIHPTKDRPGLLHDILEKFANQKVNLTKIESRPTKLKLGEYIFYMDFEGHIADKKVKNAINEIKKIGAVIIFGSYKKRY